MDQAPVPVVSPPGLPSAQTLSCANCGAALTGEYCAACGQKHEPHIHALGHFAGEALESVTHADSRLWRTMGYLLVKPGRLTREFFEGRRARYLPPFRLYLVISLAFFLAAGLPGDDDEDQGRQTTGYEKVDSLNQAADELETQLGDKGNAAAVEMRAEAAKEKARLDRLKASGADAATMEKESKDSVNVSGCDSLIAKRPADAGYGYELMLGFCKKLAHTSGRQFVTATVHNIPRAMFLFLPLMALFMKLLYWRPKRYYVEHLLFLVHNHAFVFLAFIFIVVIVRLPLNGNLLGFAQALVWLYMFWYIFRAMRVYYGQSRGLTFGKYTLIGLLYYFTAILGLLLTAAFSALTIGD